MSCPKCGFRLPRVGLVADECPACGIVMSKWRDATGLPPRTQPQPPKKGSRSGEGRTLVLLVLLLALVGWVWQEMPRDVPEVPASSSPPRGSVAASTESPEPVRVEAPGQEQGAPRTQGSPDEELTEPSAPPESGLSSTESSEEEEPVPVVTGESPIDSEPTGFPDTNPMPLTDWYSGMDGYMSALRRKAHVQVPMVIYFRSSWCPWSRRFETEFLSQRSIGNWVSELVRVHIDPESGLEESELAARFGVTAYPSFYVIPAGAGRPKKIAPFPGGEAISPAEFLAASRDAAY
ncbi:MAG: thioredoxin family protein [Myxococcota bacterium]|nr:thioredoxin family protein [Myxococcota bacterium]